MKNDSQQRTVFIRSGGVGDFILSLPLLWRLYDKSSEFYLITHPSFGALLGDLPPDITFIDINSRQAAGLYEENGVSPEWENDLRHAYVYYFAQRHSELTAHCLAAGAARVFQISPRADKPPHITHRFFQDAGEAEPAAWEPPLAPRRKPSSGQELWLHPGSGSTSKNVDLKTFARLAEGWYSLHQHKIKVILGPAEQHVATELTQRMEDRGVPVTFATSLGLADLAFSLLNDAQLFIGNDSGLTHLAAALGIPAIALFASTDPRIWRPLGNCLVLPPGME